MTFRALQALVSKNRKEFLVLGTILVGFLGTFVLLNYSNPSIFGRFLGELNPMVIAISIAIVAIATLSLLLSRRRLLIYKKTNPLVFFRYTLLVALFVCVAIWVDWNIVYPADIHISIPESLLFYPAMGFLVEIVFHTLPLTILLFAIPLLFQTLKNSTVVRLSMVIVALIEPTYQVFMDTYPIWALLAVWLNLFLFNIVQLYVYKVYGFVHMYGLRLVYYLLWHIIWGSLRLELLF